MTPFINVFDLLNSPFYYTVCTFRTWMCSRIGFSLTLFKHKYYDNAQKPLVF